MAILNRDKPRRAMPIPDGVEVSEEVTVQQAPSGTNPIPSNGNTGVITDFIIREISGPSKKQFIDGAKSAQNVPPFLGDFVSKLTMSELSEAKKFNNVASPDTLAEVLAKANNFGFNLLSSEMDDRGNPVYSGYEPQEDQAKALAVGLNRLIRGGFIDPSAALQWTKDSLQGPQQVQQPQQRMGQLQNQQVPEQVDFSVSESFMPEDLPPMERI